MNPGTALMVASLVLSAGFYVVQREQAAAPAADLYPRPGTPDRPSFNAYAPVLYLDAETGCFYLSTDAVQALVPRMGADGKQVCGAIPLPAAAAPKPPG